MSNEAENSRLNPDERREQILSVAAGHFARDDGKPVSVSAIARDAGVTRALVYHYFPGRDSLLDAVLQRETDAVLVSTMPDPARSVRVNLEHALNAYLDHFAASGGALRDLFMRQPGAPSIVNELAAGSHVVHADRIIALAGLEDTALMRFAVMAWLGLVTEGARAATNMPDISRQDIIRLSLRTFEAATGRSIDDLKTQPDQGKE